MKSTSGNHAIYTTYSTHAICVLGKRRGKMRWKMRGKGGKVKRKVKGKGERGRGESCHKKRHKWCFSSVSRPNIFYDAKNIRSFFMTKRRHLKNIRSFFMPKRRHLKNLRTFCHKKRTIIVVMMLYRAGIAPPYTCVIKKKKHSMLCNITWLMTK